MRASGYTVVELTVAVVIGTLLTALAVGQVGAARERARLAMMQSDLRSLAVAEASYFYDFRVYTPDVDVLESRGLVVGVGVTITLNEATTTGWAATSSHLDTPRQCYLWAGAAAPVVPATETGAISCDGY